MLRKDKCYKEECNIRVRMSEFSPVIELDLPKYGYVALLSWGMG